jgi:hypothetical protein
MPPSKIIEGDHELAEIYSMSMTHQLHCLVTVHSQASMKDADEF